MKIRTKVIVANLVIMVLFSIISLLALPTFRNYYYNEQAKHLSKYVNNSVGTPYSEMIKFGSEGGYTTLEINSNDSQNNEPIRGGARKQIPDNGIVITKVESLRHGSYRAFTNDNSIYLIRVNERAIDQFVNDFTIFVGVFYLLFIIVDLIAMQVILKTIVKPLSKIEDHVEKLSDFNFGNYSKINGNDELSKLNENINRLDKTLDNFVSNRSTLASSLSHELKTPVAIISSTMDLHELKSGPYENLDYAKRIIEENLLKITEISHMALQIFQRKTTFEFSDINVDEYIQESIIKLEGIFAKNHNKIEYTAGNLIFKADRESLELILSTIFQNIEKYARENSVIKISSVNNELVISNEIKSETNRGTQKGLDLAKTLASESDLHLDLNYDENRYFVKIYH